MTHERRFVLVSCFVTSSVVLSCQGATRGPLFDEMPASDIGAQPTADPSGNADGTDAGAPEKSPTEDASGPSTPKPPPTPPVTALPGVTRVWAVNDGEKVAQDDLVHASAMANAAWDGIRIKIFGARNEVLAFQVIVEADAAGAKGLTASLPALRRRGGTGAITYAPPGADPTAYAGKAIQVFTESYMNVTRATSATWVFTPGSAAAPSDPVGWKPVQLVPENAKRGRGGLPMDVAPRNNQAIWFDVYTGRGLPAGTYDGTLRISAGGAFRDILVELELFDFDLPDENTMTSMVYFEPEQLDLYHGVKGLEDRYHRFAHRQRIELVYAYSASSVAAGIGRFDGSDFTVQKGYEGPGDGVGNIVVPASFYTPGESYDVRSSAWETSDAWMTMLAANVPKATTFLYMPDEPSPKDFPRIKAIAENVKSNSGPGKALPIFVTTAYDAALDGVVDDWCPGPGRFDVARAKEERDKGNKYWFYNGKRPNAGAIIIDAPATDARVMPWAAFKHEAAVYFYWHGNHWEHNAQKTSDRKQNVWKDPITFDNRSQLKGDRGFINGDGVLMYPGTEAVHPEEDRAIAGPVSTIQLANLRRGMQDHIYLTLARKRGLEAEVTKALTAIVPAVFSEAGATVAFPEHGDAYEKARHALGVAISASK